MMQYKVEHIKNEKVQVMENLFLKAYTHMSIIVFNHTWNNTVSAKNNHHN